MLYERTPSVSSAVHGDALRVGSGGRIRETQRVLDVQTRAVLPQDAGIRPEISFVPIWEFIEDSIHRNCGGQQACHEMHQVHVVAADIHEGVCGVSGEPVLKIRVAVVPFLHQTRGSQFELAELAVAIAVPRHHTPWVETLVVFHAHE